MSPPGVGAGRLSLAAAARWGLLGVVAASSVLGATLAALPALAVGLLVLFDTSFGSTLAVLRALVEPFLWPGAGASGVMHVRDLMAHPALAAAWSGAASALAAGGLAVSADRRAGWWWAVAAWGASAAIGGEAVGVVLVPAGVARGAMAVLGRKQGRALPGPAKGPRTL